MSELPCGFPIGHLDSPMRCNLSGGHEGECKFIASHARSFAAKSSRIDFLERKRETTKADLLAKFEDADWHGVADAAMDLRDIESELKGLRA